MKRLIFIILVVLALPVPKTEAASWDISELFGGSVAGSSDAQEKSSDEKNKKGGLGDLLSGVANALGVGAKNLTVDKMVGTWKYVAPAVSFKSDNFLLKAGGAAAAQQVESKLAPYYKMAGLNALTITVAEDSTFTFKARMANLSGTIYKNTSTGNFVFEFKAFKKISIGSMESYIVLNGDKMELTFDVSKLMTLIEKAGSLTGNSTLKGVSAVLNKYDGMTAGFELERQASKK